jgi:3-methyladenine DNA glycosylase AlkD
MNISATLQNFADPQQAAHLQRFFKTGPGDYAEGDVFIGIKAPVLRKVAEQFRNLPLTEVETLLRSEIHEFRFTALVLLIQHYQNGNAARREAVFECYVKNANHINNWDLVDISAPHIIGAHLLDLPRDLLYQWAYDEYLWRRRIAIVATFAFIRRNDFADTLALAEILRSDTHDLIHKAVGWMLREVGKRDVATAREFLDSYAAQLPRTTLRYAIEKFPPTLRQAYLNKRA